MTRCGRVGVIGTSGTIRSSAYQTAQAGRRGVDPRLSFCSSPWQRKVGIDNQVARLTAESYLHELKQAGIDTLVLGCTHYPLLKPLIAEIMGPDVVLVDSAEETARTVVATLADEPNQSPAADQGNNHYYVSDIPAGFIRVGNRSLGGRLGDVYQVDLDKDGEEC